MLLLYHDLRNIACHSQRLSGATQRLACDSQFIIRCLASAAVRLVLQAAMVFKAATVPWAPWKARSCSQVGIQACLCMFVAAAVWWPLA